MAFEIKMPKLAMAMNEGTVNKWMFENGDFVEKGQILMEVETEKVAYELESPGSGYLRITTPVGDTVPVESIIGHLTENQSDSVAKSTVGKIKSSTTAGPDLTPSPTEMQPPGAEQNVAYVGGALAQMPQAQTAEVISFEPRGAQSVAAAPARIFATPLARRLAKDHDLDLAQIKGTGPKGRIRKREY